MGVLGFIETFRNGDIGIITQSANSETSIRLNERDFQGYLESIIEKAKSSGLYKCNCEKENHSQLEEVQKEMNTSAPACPIKPFTRKKSYKPRDKPSAKMHGGDEECKE